MYYSLWIYNLVYKWMSQQATELYFLQGSNMHIVYLQCNIMHCISLLNSDTSLPIGVYIDSEMWRGGSVEKCDDVR